jgi:hypothetical protein
VPAALAAAVDRCLAKRPDDRFATGEELAEVIGPVADATQVTPQMRFLVKSLSGFRWSVSLGIMAVAMGPGIVSALWASERTTLLVLGIMGANKSSAASATNTSVRSFAGGSFCVPTFSPIPATRKSQSSARLPSRSRAPPKRCPKFTSTTRPPQLTAPAAFTGRGRANPYRKVRAIGNIRNS